KDRATFRVIGKQGHPWKGVWVAGLTSGSSAVPRKLAYLMFIEEVFDHQYDLWNYLPASVRNAKSASSSPIGDLYEPRPSASANPHSHVSYQPPVPGHVHTPKGDPRYWHKDIELWRAKSC